MALADEDRAGGGMSAREGWRRAAPGLGTTVWAGTQPVSELLTSAFLAQEILRSAVGTIGLVASVPITTALAVPVADLRPAPQRSRP